MSVKVTTLEREFIFDGHALPDPNPTLSVEQVREMYIPTHPEITTASITGPETVDGKLRYTFSRAIGYKG
jgi:PRTRC genetic system protein C